MQKNAIFYFLIHLSFIGIFKSFCVFASDTEEMGNKRGFDKTIIIPKTRFFSENYLGIHTQRTFPLWDSKPNFGVEGIGWGLHYSHFIKSDWSLSLNASTKPSLLRQTNEKVSLFVINEQLLRISRVYGKTHLGYGPSLGVVFPIQGWSFTPDIDQRFKREVIAGLNSEIFYPINERFLLRAGIEMWRGVNSKRYIFIDSRISISVSLGEKE